MPGVLWARYDRAWRWSDSKSGKIIMKGFNYKSVVPWGRSYDEYLDMFLLTDRDLERKILGVGDGPASFNYHLTLRNGYVTSVDPTYALNRREFEERISDTYESVMSQMESNIQSFVWERIQSIEMMGKIRLEAMGQFCADFEKGKEEGRYLEGSLPGLPFMEKSFDLVLSSHLLFFYSKNLDLEFHLASIKELIRVGKEIRIFPIVDLDSVESPHLDPVLDYLKANQIEYHIEKVRYHFQKTGNQMLRILPG